MLSLRENLNKCSWPGTNKLWALSLNSCVWWNGKWDLVDLSGDSFLQWQTWDKHFNIPNNYSDTSQHLLDSDFKSTSNFLIVHHFPLRINHWSPFQFSSPSSVFFQSFSHGFLVRSALFVLAKIIDPPSDGIERVDDVRGWMSDPLSLPLVSPIERILAEFLLFPGVLQSVADPCNYNLQSDHSTLLSSHLIRITRSNIRRPSWVPRLTSFFPSSLLSFFLSFCFRQSRKPRQKYLEIVSFSFPRKSTISYQGEKLLSLLSGEPFLSQLLPRLLPLPPRCQVFGPLPGLSDSWILSSKTLIKKDSHLRRVSFSRVSWASSGKI